MIDFASIDDAHLARLNSLMMLIGEDKVATAALDRGDDLALLRRIRRCPSLSAAQPLAAWRAEMRGHSRSRVGKALSLVWAEVDQIVSYQRILFEREITTTDMPK